MMRSASRQALSAVREAQHSAVSGRVSVATMTTIADDLYGIAGVLVAQPRLRRALGDPASSAEGRAALIERLLEGKVGKQAMAIAKAAVGERWSSPWDLTDALEGAGDDTLFAAADKDGDLDRVEDELFRLERILANEGEITGLLDERTVDVERRIGLLDTLIQGKVAPVTRSLVDHAAASQRKRSIVLAIDDLLERAAARRERSVARVVSATPLTDEQEQRLTAALSDMYGRPISVRSALDPSLRGGLVIRVGDEVIDGSIARRFATARAAMAG